MMIIGDYLGRSQGNTCLELRVSALLILEIQAIALFKRYPNAHPKTGAFGGSSPFACNAKSRDCVLIYKLLYCLVCLSGAAGGASLLSASNFVSVGEDGCLKVWDERSPGTSICVHAHMGPANSVACSANHVVATGAWRVVPVCRLDEHV